MFEGGYNLTGFRVCVRRLPIIGGLGPSGYFHTIDARPIFTRLTLGPVNTNATNVLIPKNPIIRHSQSPAFCAELTGKQQSIRNAPVAHLIAIRKPEGC
jgi:hypothetical protein